ncbi:GntR family transcriptional regulator [Agrococcus casei]|uniref:GntR family transcriptional regulator n=1 Tax=Agrococcus casei TaxID=343512 RepID=UPI003F9043BA
MLQRQAAPLREQAVIELRSQIVSGALAPGIRLKEKDLGDLLGVSRTVVREALRQLESERLVRLQPGSGPIVAELTRDEARQLYEVRAALEGAAARLSARNATDAQIDRLREALEAVAGRASSDLVPMLELKNRFYDALIAASGNAIIGEQLDGVQARISQLRAVTLSHPNREGTMLHELTAVIDAIASHDADEAYRLSVAHVMAASAIALDHLQQEGNA